MPLSEDSSNVLHLLVVLPCGQDKCRPKSNLPRFVQLPDPAWLINHETTLGHVRFRLRQTSHMCFAPYSQQVRMFLRGSNINLRSVRNVFAELFSEGKWYRPNHPGCEADKTIHTAFFDLEALGFRISLCLQTLDQHNL